MPGSVEREHEIGLIDELVCRGAGTVQVISGPDPRLVVVGPPDLVDRVVVRYRSMKLIVSFRLGPNPLSIGGMGELRVIVATDAISRLVAQGFASVHLGESARRPLSAVNLRVINSGSGRITGDITTEKLVVRVRGVGGISLSGDAGELDARLSGVGSLDCEDLVCGTARVGVNSVGSARVMVLDELRASVTGAGHIGYRGSGRLARRGGQIGRIQYLE
jgi:hypothetical protein